MADENVTAIGHVMLGALGVEIRPARDDDLPALNALAMAAKAHWGYSRAQLEVWRAEIEIHPWQMARRPVFVAQTGSPPAIAGFVQVATDTTPWSLDALWVDPATMRRGVGKGLLAFAREFAAARGQAELQIDADPNAEPFYLRCGARRVGEVAAPIEGEPGRVRPQLRLGTRDTRNPDPR